MRIILLLTLYLLAMLVRVAFAADGVAPPRPEFEAFMNSRSRPMLQSGTGPANGYIPPPVAIPRAERGPARLQSVELPARFDLRDSGKLTPVRNQSTCGACWTFGTYGMLESNLMAQDGEPASLDFSENHMKNRHGFDWSACEGGNYDMSSAYLLRGEGPVAEADDPYSTTMFTSPDRPRRKTVTNIMFLPSKASASDFSGYAEIKQALMTYGAVATDLYMNFDLNYLTADEKSYYYNGTAPYGNHAVTVVGWDDGYSRYNFPQTPPGDGAWIIKNSYGTVFGENGYFHVSYYDARIMWDRNVVTTATRSADSFEQIYSFDEFGWTGGYPAGTYDRYANIFTNQSGADQTISAVGFWATAPNAGYTVQVWLGPGSANPASGSKVAETSGTVTYAGYYTVNLPTPVTVGAGAKFSAVVRLTGANVTVPLEMKVTNYASGVSASGQPSFVSMDGTSWANVSASGYNVGVKAYAIADTTDIDGDGLPDAWEITHFTDIASQGAGGDFDADDLSNLQEYQQGTNPTAADTDGDSLPDGWEVQHGLAPTLNDAAGDADGDGLSNAQEYSAGTNPADADSDDDGLPDGWETGYGFNPLVNNASADPDGDGLSNLQECQRGTNPTAADTDGDSLPDGWEVTWGFNPLVANSSAEDNDSDGLTSQQEYAAGTNPNLPDTDNDGMPDGWEVDYSLNPLVNDAGSDADGDGNSNLEEFQNATNPRVPTASLSLADVAVDEGQPVTLTAGATAPLTSIAWTKTEGPAVTLTGADTLTPGFTLLDAPYGGACLRFKAVADFSDGTHLEKTCLVHVRDLDTPVADAGLDQSVAVGASISLDGGCSFHPQQGTIHYRWRQTGGTPVAFAANASQTGFIAPTPVGATPLMLEFSLDASKSPGFEAGSYTSDTCRIYVGLAEGETPPVADAGWDTLASGASTVLDGSGSSSAAGIAGYAWTQVHGPTVMVDNAGQAQATLHLPGGGTIGYALVFELLVTDTQGLSAGDRVIINVPGSVNRQPPVADAGRDVRVNTATSCMLNGAGSRDSEGSSLRYRWRQVSGDPVTLNDPSSPTPLADISQVDGQAVFVLTVWDENGLMSEDSMSITTGVSGSATDSSGGGGGGEEAAA
ncbi:lectin like domain-containing protein [Desulfocurvibacter africanus]|uniref:lectin like domain-containing protein n=1 Tax=Desulfocurvibacter africanus TaxID=873 RepID=UPI000410CC67|nr:lectin like domain-containing protein [Desulfocurvibacter africanus]